MTYKEKKFYKLSNDKVFKILFANPKNEKFLKMLLEKVLKAKVADICYLGTEVYPDNVKNKDMRLDCLVDTNLGIIEIEMNYYNRGYLKIRNTVYMFKIVTEDYEVGETYSEKQKFTQVNLTNGLGAMSEPVRLYKLQTDDHIEFINNLRIYEINLDYYHKYWLNKDVEKIKEDFIFVAFNLDEEELDELAKICEESRELVEMIKQVNKKYYNIFTIEEDEKRIHNTLIEEAKNDGLKQGVEQGAKEAKIDMIKNMLDNNLSLEQIMNITKMNEEEILEIQKDIM